MQRVWLLQVLASECRQCMHTSSHGHKNSSQSSNTMVLVRKLTGTTRSICSFYFQVDCQHEKSIDSFSLGSPKTKTRCSVLQAST